MKEIMPVHELLIALCRTSFTEEDRGDIKKLASGIDNWERFVWLANEHGISALVYYNFKELGLTAMVPEKELSVLYNAYMKSLGRNTILSEKYDELEKLLGGIGIKPLLIKGMALERTVYGNRGLRQMNDVDFLVERKRSMEAWEYLLTMGYKPHIIKSPRYKEILPWIGKHMPELYKDGISFEIHHSLFEGEEEHDVLSPRIHFLFLVKHLHYHEMVQGESQLRLYTDLLLMLKKYGAELLKAELYRMAEELDMGDILAEKLFLLEHFFAGSAGHRGTAGDTGTGKINATVDKGTGSVAFDTGTIPDKQSVISRFIDFLDNPKDNVAGISRRKNYRQRIRNIPGRRRRFIYIMGDIFPSYSYMRHRYKKDNRLILTLLYLHRMAKLSWLVF